MFLVSTKREKRDQSESLTKFVRIMFYDYFHIKISLKLLEKSLLRSAFSIITCRTYNFNFETQQNEIEHTRGKENKTLKKLHKLVSYSTHNSSYKQNWKFQGDKT